nr:DUF6479 family protein [Streptomyces olivochromogenes]
MWGPCSSGSGCAAESPDRPTARSSRLCREGPVREQRTMREPNEVPRATREGDRLTPHLLGNAPQHAEPEPDPSPLAARLRRIIRKRGQRRGIA